MPANRIATSWSLGLAREFRDRVRLESEKFRAAVDEHFLCKLVVNASIRTEAGSDASEKTWVSTLMSAKSVCLRKGKSQCVTTEDFCTRF